MINGNDGGDVASLFSRDYIPIKSLRFEHSAFLEGPGESLGGVEGPAEEIGLVEIPREATVGDNLKPTAADHSQLVNGKTFPVDMSPGKSFAELHFWLTQNGVGTTTSPGNHTPSRLPGDGFPTSCHDQTIHLNSDETNKDDDNNKKHDNKKNGNKRKRKPGGGIGNETADCWKYFDPKMERPDGPDGPLVKMAHFCDFLEKFKEKTELVSTQSSPVARLFYSEILDVDKHLREWEVVPKFKLMVEKMRLKYDKHLMENGCILEENEYEENTPFDGKWLTDNEKEDKVKQLVYEVETNMGVLFALYNEKYGTKLTNNSSDVHKSSSTQSRNTTRRRGNTFLNSFKSQNTSRSIGGDDELKKYLKEPILELDDEEDFDILSWWKINSPRFPIVSKMAKDILSIQISTVASESAFSTSGRILDPYRNALSPQIVEALLCTQSWVRTSQKNIYMDDLENLMKDEEVVKDARLFFASWQCKLAKFATMAD
ncbi:zinc finger BED domain-containing protein RICESLEEPER 2 [Tanacetum coccineum]|uniref:Zinc finger BED domain-containing protein RICESLEEPER 2 n=1 Tax=Tanacetum coccineum TaxID=301880 RepID=A0ABQ4WPX9_9ASTR